MMTKDILNVVEVVSNEKGVEKEIIFEAMEAALASAIRRRNDEEGIDVRVEIDRTNGDYRAFRQWKVFADESTELETPECELRMIDALDINPDAQPGDFVEEPMPEEDSNSETSSAEFGRIAAQTAKQVIVQKVREAERAQVVEASACAQRQLQHAARADDVGCPQRGERQRRAHLHSIA